MWRPHRTASQRKRRAITRSWTIRPGERQIGHAASSDTRWKVPGVLDWSTVTHNPFVDVNKDTTTLYGSDRDVFLFLVDDTNPIEAGRLSDDGVAGRIGSMIAG